VLCPYFVNSYSVKGSCGRAAQVCAAPGSYDIFFFRNTNFVYRSQVRYQPLVGCAV
jgi:hypothetical protein